MKNQRYHLVAVFLLLVAMTPARALPQSQTPPDETQALRKLVEEMQAQMAKMQAEIDRLKGTKTEVAQPTQAATPPSTAPSQQNGTIQTAEPPRVGPTSSHLGDATASYREFSEDTVAAARFNNVPLDPKYHGFFQLPGTQTILKIGGYFKTDFIYDLKPAGNTDSFIPSSFPIPQPTGVNNNTVSIRPTRLSLDFRVPYTQVGEVRFYVETDFFGSNSTTPRLRHAYAQARNFLIGQTFTNFMDPDGFADTLDFQGPNGMVSLRNPQFRYGFALSSHTTFYVSVEKPSSDIIFKTAQFNAQPNAPSPDGAIRLREEFERGHFQVAGLFRSVAAFLPDGRTDSVFGWGVNTSLGLKTFGQDNLIFAVAAGHGISRYIQDTSGLGIDAEPDVGCAHAFGGDSSGGSGGILPALLVQEVAFQRDLLLRRSERYRFGSPNYLQSCHLHRRQPDLESRWLAQRRRRVLVRLDHAAKWPISECPTHPVQRKIQLRQSRSRTKEQITDAQLKSLSFRAATPA